MSLANSTGAHHTALAVSVEEVEHPAAVEVDFNASVLIVAALFVALMFILKPTLFDPMLRLFEERERRTDGAKHQARAMDQASSEALAKYEQAMAKARQSANAERDKTRAEGLKAEADILAEVRVQTGKALEAGRTRVHRDLEAARAELQADSGALAKALASRVLGREVQG